MIIPWVLIGLVLGGGLGFLAGYHVSRNKHQQSGQGMPQQGFPQQAQPFAPPQQAPQQWGRPQQLPQQYPPQQGYGQFPPQR